MIESTEQKEQQKSTQKRKKNNNGTSYANLHITFSHDRYFATDFLLRFSTTVLDQIQTVHGSKILYQCYLSETIS